MLMIRTTERSLKSRMDSHLIIVDVTVEAQKEAGVLVEVTADEAAMVASGVMDLGSSPGVAGIAVTTPINNSLGDGM